MHHTNGHVSYVVQHTADDARCGVRGGFARRGSDPPNAASGCPWQVIRSYIAEAAGVHRRMTFATLLLAWLREVKFMKRLLIASVFLAIIVSDSQGQQKKRASSGESVGDSER